MTQSKRRLSDERAREAASLILAGRRAGTVMDDLPASCKPDTLADAFVIRDLVFDGFDDEGVGWFVGCSNPIIQRQLGLDEPYCARLAKSTVHESPATLDSKLLPSITLEVEFAFRLKRALPPRPTPYSKAEVADAIATVHPAIEVVTSHFTDWTHQPIFNIIADNGTDGALICGEGVALAEVGPLADVETQLFLNGESAASGSGFDVLEDSLNAMVWLANRQREDGIGLNAGDINNTGSTTPMVHAKPGDECRAVFKGIGDVEIAFSGA